MDEPTTPPIQTQTPHPQPVQEKKTNLTLFLLIGMMLFLLLIIGEVIYLLVSGIDLPLLTREDQPKPTQAPLPTTTPTAKDIAGEHNTKRRSDIMAILETVSQYQIENQGKLPDGITSENRIISSEDANICSSLVPFFIAALPIDPLISAENGLVTDCSSQYDTGYTISVSATDKRITVTAPNAQLGETISVTR